MKAFMVLPFAFLVGLLGQTPTTPTKLAEAPIPDASLSVGYYELPEFQGIFVVLRLDCRRGLCVRTFVAINQCMGPYWAIKPEVKTNRDSLKVTYADGAFRIDDEIENQTGQAKFTFVLRHEPVRPGEVIRKITGFSGGMIKKSKILGRVVASEYKALPEVFNSVEMRCSNVIVPGLGFESEQE